MKKVTKKFGNLLGILQILRQNDWTKSSEIAEKLGVDERTVFRYISEVEAAFAPLRLIESSRDGYRLFHIELLQTHPNPAFPAALTGLGDGTDSENSLLSLILWIEAKNETPNANFKNIVRALTEQHRLKLEAFVKGDRVEMTAVPLRLMLHHYSITLNYIHSETGEYSSIALNRILSATVIYTMPVTEEQFKEATAVVQSAWGVMVSNTPTKLEVQVSQDLMKYLSLHPLHSSQKLISESGGNAEFSIKVHNINEFVRFSMSFGKAMRIIAPKSAMKKARSYLEEMAEHYKSDKSK